MKTPLRIDINYIQWIKDLAEKVNRDTLELQDINDIYGIRVYDDVIDKMWEEYP